MCVVEINEACFPLSHAPKSHEAARMGALSDLREGNRMNPVPVLSSVADNQHQDPQAEDGMQARESAQHVWHMCGLLARPLHGQFHRVGPRDALSCPRPAMRTTGECIPFTKPSLPFLVFG